MAIVTLSGLYFAHPDLSAVALAKVEAKYFQVGPIEKDQMQDNAKRKELNLETCERWLAPNRGY